MARVVSFWEGIALAGTIMQLEEHCVLFAVSEGEYMLNSPAHGSASSLQSIT